jgi:hypothetical protein
MKITYFNITSICVLIGVVIALTVSSCVGNPCNDCPKKINAGEYDFHEYEGKVVETINYKDVGNDLTISFEDGSTLVLHSYKYDIKVVE